MGHLIQRMRIEAGSGRNGDFLLNDDCGAEFSCHALESTEGFIKLCASESHEDPSVRHTDLVESFALTSEKTPLHLRDKARKAFGLGRERMMGTIRKGRNKSMDLMTHRRIE